MQDKWEVEGRKPIDRIKREIRKSIETHDLEKLEYFYVLEGRSKWGKSKTPLHLHGFFIADAPLIATRFKVAMERAVSLAPRGNNVTRTGRSKGNPVLIERAYDVEDDGKYGRGRWASYIAKNATKWDKRITGKRTYMSRTATKTVREFWELLRTSPY